MGLERSAGREVMCEAAYLDLQEGDAFSLLSKAGAVLDYHLCVLAKLVIRHDGLQDSRADSASRHRMSRSSLIRHDLEVRAFLSLHRAMAPQHPLSGGSFARMTQIYPSMASQHGLAEQATDYNIAGGCMHLLMMPHTEGAWGRLGCTLGLYMAWLRMRALKDVTLKTEPRGMRPRSSNLVMPWNATFSVMMLMSGNPRSSCTRNPCQGL